MTHYKLLKIAWNLEATSHNMQELHPTARSSKREASNNKINKVVQAKSEVKGNQHTQCALCMYNRILYE